MRILVALALLSVAACNRSRPATPPDPALAGLPPTGAKAGAPSTDKVPAGPVDSLSGTVLEKVDAADYSYLRLRTPGGETWAAVNASEVTIGAEVTITSPLRMDGFESKTLKRRFDRIVFGTLESGLDRAPHVAQPSAGTAIPEAAKASARTTLETGDGRIARATGAEAATVSEVVGRKAALAGKPVKVHARVVKFTAGVLGKNWLHVRDGSGTEDRGDHDLTVTTTDVTAIGQVVTLRGRVSLDRDFGSGYAYPVLVEDAKLER